MRPTHHFKCSAMEEDAKMAASFIKVSSCWLSLTQSRAWIPDSKNHLNVCKKAGYPFVEIWPEQLGLSVRFGGEVDDNEGTRTRSESIPSTSALTVIVRALANRRSSGPSEILTTCTGIDVLSVIRKPSTNMWTTTLYRIKLLTGKNLDGLSKFVWKCVHMTQRIKESRYDAFCVTWKYLISASTAGAPRFDLTGPTRGYRS